MNRYVLLISLVVVLPNLTSSGQTGSTDASALFQSKCGICHTVGKGRLVGPDLAGVNDRRPEEWLLKFIHSSQAMVKSGDPDAVALFEEFNKTIMPDPGISDTEIKTILQYIAENSGASGGATAYESVLADAGSEEVEHGRKLYNGNIAFANGGPSCIACHNGLSGTYFSEKSYAKDLGASFSTLGEQGVKGILENPPFPVMARAFLNKPLLPEETRALLAFLQQADPQQAAKAAVKPGSGFMLYGLLGAASLILVFSALWYSRKSKSVNHAIYKRQIRSIN
ncbi:MAG: cytochrome c [Saprospiraceae bacterium]|nr:cytochrome c [Saprospiraceae bacterium]